MLTKITRFIRKTIYKLVTPHLGDEYMLSLRDKDEILGDTPIHLSIANVLLKLSNVDDYLTVIVHKPAPKCSWEPGMEPFCLNDVPDYTDEELLARRKKYTVKSLN